MDRRRVAGGGGAAHGLGPSAAKTRLTPTGLARVSIRSRLSEQRDHMLHVPVSIVRLGATGEPRDVAFPAPSSPRVLQRERKI
jgi:hypothetical protein